MTPSSSHHQDLRHLAAGYAVLASLAVSASLVAIAARPPASLVVLVLACGVTVGGIPGWRRVLALQSHRGLDEALEVDLERKRRIQAVLNAGDTLSIVFQPVIDLTSNLTVGWEALTRFHGDDLSPRVWFEEAGAVGLAVELELLAVSRALDSAPRPEYLAINVGPATLVDERFIALMRRRRQGPLVVELTEHAVIDDYAVVIAALDQLRQLGIRVAVDDAGSGFSSLRHVISIAPDIIKLDQALIASIDRDQRRRTLATSLATFAAEIGSELVAEGIEREEELRVCEEIGIRFGQG
ncbi:MAG TPA: EAL domain-containing protein, partial [Acidimicrobiales bacterium]